MMVQFLIKLQPEFESIRGSLLNREVTHTIDVVLAVVLREETMLGNQVAIESMSLPAVALLAQKSTIDYRRRPNRSWPAHQANQMDITKLADSFSSGHDLERLIQDSIAATLPGAISSALSAISVSATDVTRLNKFLTLWHN
ncbi:hypothetical protein KY285_014500 [Solanum tuberosum]|nr:hypothetical protein KY285_014500 [Solanum tuberosum]